jgi:hypothetical protein
LGLSFTISGVTVSHFDRFSMMDSISIYMNQGTKNPRLVRGFFDDVTE